ncbi:hypothetical protein WA026_011338 [Henosepilachna vigintioctopunctata]|uniref:Uncharacterized protein n=1 Tax=Henosepilachna vigintioctopunctata TaxID=420089 RepID=A0AAW1TX92_9CUCU
MFFFLVKYIEDGIYQVVPKVFKRGSKVFAKYLDGNNYPAEIIAKNRSYNVLNEILRNLQLDLPKVIVDSKVSKRSEEKGILIEAMKHPILVLSDVHINSYDNADPQKMKHTEFLSTDSVHDQIALIEDIPTIQNECQLLQNPSPPIQSEVLSLEDCLPLITVVQDIATNLNESPVFTNEGQSSQTKISSAQDSVPLVTCKYCK